eukprot:CAMPEP_0197478380 /NCGR_PEP_ID=MMETSP1309-20131121/25976_1 /TAXON_ID=464262 /ORGANISM="Genus nov. species nov., Strain RCC998" /LENGTH=77 /DNA_ID=CAMNT_0043019755 /DNA_START=8 /DNA_END=237 /DNA_ORIENTATION=+
MVRGDAHSTLKVLVRFIIVSSTLGLLQMFLPLSASVTVNLLLHRELRPVEDNDRDQPIVGKNLQPVKEERHKLVRRP